MSDLISRQAAIDEINEWIKAFRENGHKESAADARLIQDGIIQLPSAQPERKKGRWYLQYYVWFCDQCGKNPTKGMGYVQGADELFDFCPHCGAKMDGERREDDEID